MCVSSFFQELLQQVIPLPPPPSSENVVAGRDGPVRHDSQRDDRVVAFLLRYHCLCSQDRPQGHHIPWRPFEKTEHFHPERMRLHCSYNRLTMGIPSSIVTQVERKKLFDVSVATDSFSDCRGSHYDFGSNDEGILREAQRRSYFAVTHRRPVGQRSGHYDHWRVAWCRCLRTCIWSVGRRLISRCIPSLWYCRHAVYWRTGAVSPSSSALSSQSPSDGGDYLVGGFQRLSIRHGHVQRTWCTI